MTDHWEKAYQKNTQRRRRIPVDWIVTIAALACAAGALIINRL